MAQTLLPHVPVTPTQSIPNHDSIGRDTRRKETPPNHAAPSRLPAADVDLKGALEEESMIRQNVGILPALVQWYDQSNWTRLARMWHRTNHMGP
jgi:hypothetical protein